MADAPPDGPSHVQACQVERLLQPPKLGQQRADLTVYLVNGSGWGTTERLLQATKGDLYFIAEHRLSQERFRDKQAQAAARGWRLIGGPCSKGPKGHPAGGVCILAKGFLDLGRHPSDRGDVIVPGRAAGTVLQLKRLGPLYLISFYGFSGDGLGPANLDLLATVLARAGARGLPFLIAGDFNMSADVLAPWLSEVHPDLVVLAPEGPTCLGTSGGSTLDFVVADARAAASMTAPEIDTQVACSPHAAVTFQVSGDAGAEEVHQPRGFPTLPEQAVFGPAPPPAMQASAADIFTDAFVESFVYDDVRLTELYETWRKAAHLELTGSLGKPVAASVGLPPVIDRTSLRAAWRTSPPGAALVCESQAAL